MTSDQKIVHKEALVKMLRVLSGDKNIDDTARILQEMNVKEEDEVTMCELFDQYIRQGRAEGRVEGRAEGRVEGRAEGRIEWGAESLILDNLEEGRSEDVIIAKLMRRFSMDEATAMQYFEKYAGVIA